MLIQDIVWFNYPAFIGKGALVHKSETHRLSTSLPRLESGAVIAHAGIWRVADKAAIQRVKFPPCQLPDSDMEIT